MLGRINQSRWCSVETQSATQMRKIDEYINTKADDKIHKYWHFGSIATLAIVLVLNCTNFDSVVLIVVVF